MANACILEFILRVYSCRSRLTLAFKYNAIMGFMSAFPLLTLYMFHAPACEFTALLRHLRSKSALAKISCFLAVRPARKQATSCLY
ncbi:hypothetical protein H5410_017210 [Solanum commersonii]|uniref:Uncharacterized protein n=1 Tax=Solanum commersonii TaxID=4109 RepID=A0A9J5ZZE0_SOLCO|nr:hypothetical protein H5410_017210 [Solanum commersonii]